VSNWNIRQAHADDAADLQQCMESAYMTYQQRMNGKSLPPLEADYSLEITNHPSWVVEIDDRIVGGLIMSFETDAALVINVAVHRQAQGLGLGRALLDLAQNEAKQRQYSQLLLATHVLLIESISLYEYLGWKETNRDDVRVYMSKDI